jgi:hypothetical protein
MTLKATAPSGTILAEKHHEMMKTVVQGELGMARRIRNREGMLLGP